MAVKPPIPVVPAPIWRDIKDLQEHEALRQTRPTGDAHSSAFEAIRQACHLRFRPIMMTTLAALFGALPLALAAGPGSELRIPLGLSIIGGLLLSQILTLYTTPVIFLLLDRFDLQPDSDALKTPFASETDGPVI